MPNDSLADRHAVDMDHVCDVSLPINPFEALKPHFGMLLGVHDFQTIDAYHRGKQWLHNAWLHRQGVVWGMKVSIDTERNEIRVQPGLAIDALGRELFLAKPVCLNLPAWLDKHRDDEAFEGIFERSEDGRISFSAHAVIQFHPCLARQVPALMEPCEGGSTTTAYSRIIESVEVLLMPGLARKIGSPGRVRPYHRLRLLFNLEPPNRDESDAILPSDQEVIDERDRILGLVSNEQPAAYLAAFRAFAALDEMTLGPATGEHGDHVSLFPAVEPAPVILANLQDLRVNNESFEEGRVDNRVRDVHVATATIQELLCGPLFRQDGGGEPAPPSAPDAGGPRIDHESVELEDRAVVFVQTEPKFLKRSMENNVSIFVSTYDKDSGWRSKTVDDIKIVGNKVRLAIDRNFEDADELVRLVVKGTGPTPVLGANRVPLAGAVGGPPGTLHQGHDFVFLQKRED